MSLMHRLPRDTWEAIKAGDQSIREDLRAYESAVAAGWLCEFVRGSWHNSIGFEKRDLTVWYVGNGWRRATLVGGKFTGHQTMTLVDALGITPPGPEWRFISCAPKSGPLIEVDLLFVDGRIVERAHWAHGDGDGAMPAFGPAWFVPAGAAGYVEVGSSPTFWRPRPQPAGGVR